MELSLVKIDQYTYHVFALEIQNQNMNRAVQLRKKQELGFFTLLNEGTEEIKHKFIKI